MLEILVLMSLTNKIGTIVAEKGHQSSGYKWGAAAWWFGGEILGVILGTMITGGEQGLPVYLIALMGAGQLAQLSLIPTPTICPSLDRPSHQNLLSPASHRKIPLPNSANSKRCMIQG